MVYHKNHIPPITVDDSSNSNNSSRKNRIRESDAIIEPLFVSNSSSNRNVLNEQYLECQNRNMSMSRRASSGESREDINRDQSRQKFVDDIRNQEVVKDGNRNLTQSMSNSNLTARPPSSVTAVIPIPLHMHCVWYKVHALGISKLFVEIDSNLLISLSYDGYCKISDGSTGFAMFVLQNTHQCIYTGRY